MDAEAIAAGLNEATATMEAARANLIGVKALKEVNLILPTPLLHQLISRDVPFSLITGIQRELGGQAGKVVEFANQHRHQNKRKVQEADGEEGLDSGSAF